MFFQPGERHVPEEAILADHDLAELVRHRVGTYLTPGTKG